MKDGRIFLVERAALNQDELFISSPNATAAKKIPDRTPSVDRRIIWDGASGNLFYAEARLLPPRVREE